MLDRFARPLIDPPLNRLGRKIAARGIGADAVTMVGLAIGIAAACSIAAGAFWLALVLLLLSRLADGLDGAVARASSKTAFGGYLDITADFLFYGLIPMAFAVVDSTANALAAAVLLTSFYFNGTSFLGFAILAEKQSMETAAQGEKSLFYSNGLLEGTETIAFFVILCLLPNLFASLAYPFAALCFFTGAMRVIAARRVFRT